MSRTKPPWKKKKIVERLVAENPDMAAFLPLLLLMGTSLYKLELLASVLNDVPPDSANRAIADLIEKLVTTLPANQEWVKQKELANIIGPIPCTPAPGSPLYELNELLAWNPCILRIEGYERATGNIEVYATHIPIPAGQLLRIEDKAIREGLRYNLTADRILWLLWEVFYRDIDLTRLKNCPICHRWFVDHSKNKSKTRCSTGCTSKRWSWEARKKAGHHLPGSKSKGGR